MSVFLGSAMASIGSQFGCELMQKVGLSKPNNSGSNSIADGSNGGDGSGSKSSDSPSPSTSDGVDPKTLTVDAAWAKLYRDMDEERKTAARNAALGGIIGVPSQYLGATDVSRQQAIAARSALGGKLSVDAFQSTLDQVGQFLVKELPIDHRIVPPGQSRQVLLIENVENRSGVSNADLGAALDSLSSTLTNSDAVRTSFLILSPTAAKGQEAMARAGAAQPFMEAGVLGDQKDKPAGYGEYDPSTIYVVSGKFFQVNDDRKHRMYLKTLLEVWRPLSGETVKAKEFSRAFGFHPYRLEWVPIDSQVH